MRVAEPVCSVPKTKLQAELEKAVGARGRGGGCAGAGGAGRGRRSKPTPCPGYGHGGATLARLQRLSLTPGFRHRRLSEVRVN